MPLFRSAGRSLFLLALFHMAGGPVVLCGVFLLAKFAGSQALHRAEPVSGHCPSFLCASSTGDLVDMPALDSATRDSIPAAAQPWTHDTSPGKPVLPPSRTPHGGKGKFIGFAEVRGASQILMPRIIACVTAEPVDMCSHLGLPPPLPPPRGA